jgi:hypothetical protein
MNYEKRDSGLVVATEKAPKPPEHPALAGIRNNLFNLAIGLNDFEQTTHGNMGPHTIQSVADALVRCYENPTSYTISDLNQVIDGFVGGSE